MRQKAFVQSRTRAFCIKLNGYGMICKEHPDEVNGLLKRFIPKKRVVSVLEIDLQELKKEGVRGIITDLDNTLVGATVAEAFPELILWFDRVREMDFQIVIVSNNNENRVSSFSLPLSIPFIHNAKKPSNRAFKQALKLMELAPKQAVVIGDQLLTDVLGGNRLGLHTILVRPIDLRGEGFMTRFNRRIEGKIVAALRKRGLMEWEE